MQNVTGDAFIWTAARSFSTTTAYDEFVTLWRKALDGETVCAYSEERQRYQQYCTELAAQKCLPDTFENWRKHGV